MIHLIYIYIYIPASTSIWTRPFLLSGRSCLFTVKHRPFPIRSIRYIIYLFDLFCASGESNPKVWRIAPIGCRRLSFYDLHVFYPICHSRAVDLLFVGNMYIMHHHAPKTTVFLYAPWVLEIHQVYVAYQGVLLHYQRGWASWGNLMSASLDNLFSFSTVLVVVV